MTNLHMTKEEWDANSLEWYALIGEFNVEFEHMLSVVRSAIFDRLPPDKEEDSYELSEAHGLLLGPVSAGETINLLRKAIAVFGSEAETERAKEPLKQADSINARRNRIVHTAWLVGFRRSDGTTPADPDTVRSVQPGRKLSKDSKRPSAWQVSGLTKHDVRSAIAEMKPLAYKILHLNGPQPLDLDD